MSPFKSRNFEMIPADFVHGSSLIPAHPVFGCRVTVKMISRMGLSPGCGKFLKHIF